MGIMSMETYESAMRRLSIYRNVELSEQQIESGQVKDARTVLAGMRTKYGLQTLQEENHMRKMFGEGYVTYMKHTFRYLGRRT